jgi:6-phosphofructokinase 2
MGQWLDGHLTDLALNPQRQAIEGETRENLTVRARDSAAEYRFVMPGPSLSAAELQACLDAATAHLRPGDWIVASGSLPPGAPTDTWAQLARAAQSRGALCALDTSGAGLRAAIDDPSVHLSLVKPNLRELREATGEALPDAAAWNAAACRWVAQGRATRVALSLGDRGALLVGPQGAWEAAPLDVPLASSVGAGDSFLAGLLWAIDQGLEDAAALSWGMAAGTAALLHPGTGLAHADDIRRLLPVVRVRAAAVP